MSDVSPRATPAAPNGAADELPSMIGRSGARYLEELDDGRDVTIDGARVACVASHPDFAPAARTVARLLDLHADPRTARTMVAVDGATGQAVPRCYALAASAADVAERGRCFELIARTTGGLLGRSPDFLATLLASWSAASTVFGRRDRCHERRVRDYHDHSAARALCHTHAISDPPADRRGSGSAAPLALRRTSRGSDGITVRGMKMLATLAPFADDLLVYPFRPLSPGESDQALALAVPLDAPGLRIVCRAGLRRDGHAFNHPLANRFDEMDALCIFDDVLVPHERVFIDGDVELANALRVETGMTAYMWHQSAVRTAVKAELVLGLGSLVARAAGKRDTATHEKLGEMAAIAEALRALVVAAEAQAARDRFGFYVAAWSPLGASGVLNAELYPRLIELLQLVGSSGLIMHPTMHDLAAPYASELSDYFGGPHGDATQHAALLALAADLAVDGFGGRQVLYERFFLGPPEQSRSRYFSGSDLTSAEALVASLLVEPT